MALQAHHDHIGIHHNALARVLSRMIKTGAGIRLSGTRLLEVAILVLFTVWSLEMLWLAVKFIRRTTLLEFPF